MSNPTMIDAVRRLVDARALATDAADVYAARKAAFDAENAWLLEEKKTREAAVADAETDVKALALAQFAATGEKKPVAGVEVKVFGGMRYDAERAFAWARETKMALVPESLDRKAFEKIAAAASLEFVEYTSEPRVTLAKTIEIPDDTPAAAEPTLAAITDTEKEPF